MKQDFSQLARALVEEATREDEDEPVEETPKAVAGRKGGQARAAALSASERSAIAAKGGEARWAASSE
ncbi:MAG: histone H1 [Chloroflexi bacterium]|nr:histone H1 [Chloroflexota bacterium]